MSNLFNQLLLDIVFQNVVVDLWWFFELVVNFSKYFEDVLEGGLVNGSDINLR